VSDGPHSGCRIDLPPAKGGERSSILRQSQFDAVACTRILTSFLNISILILNEHFGGAAPLARPVVELFWLLLTTFLLSPSRSGVKLRDHWPTNNEYATELQQTSTWVEPSAMTAEDTDGRLATMTDSNDRASGLEAECHCVRSMQVASRRLEAMNGTPCWLPRPFLLTPAPCRLHNTS